MNLRTLCIIVCVGVSLLSSLLTAAASNVLPHAYQIASVAAGCVLSLAAAWYLGSWLKTECRNLETLLEGDESHRPTVQRLADFESIARLVRVSSERWEKVAAASRRQTQEFAAMMQGLEQRAVGLHPDSNHLRTLLAGLGEALKQQLGQCQSMVNDTQHNAAQAAEQAELQASTLTQSLSRLDQLAGSLDSIVEHLKQTTDPNGVPSSLSAIRESLDGLQRNLDQMTSDASRCEQRLSGLSEPTRELNATIQSIADLAARTDLLALNASIESLRAGEYGKGFAIVADEVRKMAEQTSEATRELSSILDAIQLAIAEASRSVANGHQQLETQTVHSRTLQQSLTRVLHHSQSDQEHLHQVVATARDQRRCLNDVATCLQQSAESSGSTKLVSESIHASMRNFSQTLSQASNVAQRLTNCRDTVTGNSESDSGSTTRSGARGNADISLTAQLATHP